MPPTPQQLIVALALTGIALSGIVLVRPALYAIVRYPLILCSVLTMVVQCWHICGGDIRVQAVEGHNLV